MATTGYAVLKKHFDRLFVGGYPGNGFEPIRTVYETAFDRKINLFDVYQTELKCAHNPISAIITLVGPTSDDSILSTGKIMCDNSVVYVESLSDSILKGIDKDDFDGYVNFVYQCMREVVHMDRFYAASDEEARRNPYVAFVKCIPMYFTFHHIKEHVSSDVFSLNPFKELMDKYILADEELTPKVLESLNNTKYSEDPCLIYRAMTCANTIELFY